MLRSVPRNIDKPNRLPEYVMVFLVAYYSTQFLTEKPLVSFGVGFMAVYFMYKFTMDKPEGLAYRFIYKYVSFGHMLPPPRKVRKFEL